VDDSAVKSLAARALLAARLAARALLAEHEDQQLSSLAARGTGPEAGAPPQRGGNATIARVAVVAVVEEAACQKTVLIMVLHVMKSWSCMSEIVSCQAAAALWIAATFQTSGCLVLDVLHPLIALGQSVHTHQIWVRAPSVPAVLRGSLSSEILMQLSLAPMHWVAKVSTKYSRLCNSSSWHDAPLRGRTVLTWSPCLRI
jgi:hypothetical protein